MNVFDTIFHACCKEAAALLATKKAQNATYVGSLCARLTLSTIHNHNVTGVVDFEELLPVLAGWWIYGLSFLIVLSTTAMLSFVSILIFLDSSMRSPTNALLATITTLDLLTCVCHEPINIHIYLLENYKELPSYAWCGIYFYVHNFLPPSFHGTAFLLNMYLSVQRYVGIKRVKGCHAIGSYRGTITAIIASVLISFGVHSMYPTMFVVEEVTAISKKVLSSKGLYYIQSCRVVDRFKSDKGRLFCAYMWLRVLVLQIPPALTLTVCNIALVRTSYRTHIYRKRLIGSVGVIAGFRPSSRRDLPVHAAVSGAGSLGERPKGSVNSCPRQVSAETEDAREGIANNENRLTNESSKHCAWTRRINGLVVPTISYAVATGIVADPTEKNMETFVCLTPHQSLTIGHQQIPSCQHSDKKHDDNLRNNSNFISERVFPVENIESERSNTFAEKCTLCTACRVVSGRSGETHITSIGQSGLQHDKHIRVGEVVTLNVRPEHVAVSNTPDRGQSGLVLDVSRKVTSVNDPDQIRRSPSETSVKPKWWNVTSSRHDRKSDGGRSEQPRWGGSAEIRSTILLLLVTSCTLVTETFVIVILLLRFSLYDSEFMSYSDLANLLMAGNLMMVINFPLNFIFFCGLSQAFRSLLKARLAAITRKLKLTG